MNLAHSFIASGIAVFGAVTAMFVPFASVLAAAPPSLAKMVKSMADLKTPPSFHYALIDLNDDGIPDAIVLIDDPRMGGSGGYNMFVAKGTKSGFRLVSSSTISRSPIFVSTERRYGWRTLLVTVGGGGAKYGQVRMRFNGSRYPLNPTMQPYASARDISAATEVQLHE